MIHVFEGLYKNSASPIDIEDSYRKLKNEPEFQLNLKDYPIEQQQIILGKLGLRLEKHYEALKNERPLEDDDPGDRGFAMHITKLNYSIVESLCANDVRIGPWILDEPLKMLRSDPSKLRDLHCRITSNFMRERPAPWYSHILIHDFTVRLEEICKREHYISAAKELRELERRAINFYPDLRPVENRIDEYWPAEKRDRAKQIVRLVRAAGEIGNDEIWNDLFLHEKEPQVLIHFARQLFDFDSSSPEYISRVRSLLKVAYLNANPASTQKFTADIGESNGLLLVDSAVGTKLI